MGEERRILVTGGAGFIGSHLVAALAHDGWHITVVDDLSTGSRAHVATNASLITFRLAMRVEPSGERVSGPLREQINHPVSLEVSEDRAVMVTAPQGEIVDAKHGRRDNRRFRQRAHEAEQRHAVCGTDAPFSEAHAGSSAEGETKVHEEGLQRHAPPCVAGGEWHV